MNIIFAGTPAFALPTLQALHRTSHRIVAVYTQPDKAAGRGLKLTASPVKQYALAHQLTICQPVTLKAEAALETLKTWQAEMMVVVAYGLLLPKTVLTIPRYGCLNVHPSLLPRWRGAAPMPRAILAGDAESGVTIMQMNEGLDTGPILLQQRYTLHTQETTQTLSHTLSQMGATLLLKTLTLLEQHQLVPTTQTETDVTYAKRITKEEAVLEWTLPAIQLERMVRAFNPWPIAYTMWQEKPLRIGQAIAIHQSTQHVPGTIVSASPAGIDIATGDGALRLLQMQLPGRKMIAATDFYNAMRQQLRVGTQLGGH